MTGTATKTKKNSSSTCDRAMRMLESFGVPNQSLRGGHSEDWIALEAELDRFTAYGYGRASQRRFLHAPHLRLGGLTPAEALGQRNGTTSVLLALRHSLAGLESSA